MATVLHPVFTPPPSHPIRRTLFVAVGMVHISVEYGVDAVRRFRRW